MLTMFLTRLEFIQICLFNLYFIVRNISVILFKVCFVCIMLLHM